MCMSVNGRVQYSFVSVNESPAQPVRQKTVPVLRGSSSLCVSVTGTVYITAAGSRKGPVVSVGAALSQYLSTGSGVRFLCSCEMRGKSCGYFLFKPRGGRLKSMGGVQ